MVAKPRIRVNLARPTADRPAAYLNRYWMPYSFKRL
jgi:hypothetical protein